MMSPLAQRLVMPAMVFSQAIPIFALAPILTLWLGYGPASKIAVTVLMIFFPVVSTFFDGMRRTDSSLIDAAEILGPGAWRSCFASASLRLSFAGVGPEPRCGLCPHRRRSGRMGGGIQGARLSDAARQWTRQGGPDVRLPVRSGGFHHAAARHGVAFRPQTCRLAAKSRIKTGGKSPVFMFVQTAIRPAYRPSSPSCRTRRRSGPARADRSSNPCARRTAHGNRRPRSAD